MFISFLCGGKKEKKNVQLPFALFQSVVFLFPLRGKKTIKA